MNVWLCVCVCSHLCDYLICVFDVDIHTELDVDAAADADTVVDVVGPPTS